MNNEFAFIKDATMLLEQIDYNSLVNSLSPVVFLYATNKLYQDYRLQKETKPKYVKIKDFNNKSINNKIEYRNIITSEFNYAICEFINVMKTRIPKSNLSNFYNNINSIKIKKEKPIFVRPNILADYDIKKNKIRIFKKESYTVIYHELLHMASSCYRDRTHFSGFKQTSLGGKIGQGINEGYTQLLTDRYFGHVNELKGIYEYEMFIAGNVEKIISRKKMENLYFNANLKGLVEELSKYASQDEVFKFILNVDFINAHLKDKNPSKTEKDIFSNIFIYNHQFLLSVYANKLKEQLNNGIINEVEMKEKLIKYLNPLGLSIKLNGIKYRTLSINYIESIQKEKTSNKKITK